MASRSKKNSAPLTFDLPLELIAKLKTSRKTRGLKSTSEAVRLAIEEFDFDACTPNREAHRQVSVRIATVQRAMLKRFARSKGSSVGELLRLALEHLAAKPARPARR
jgi:hypothetical protein